MSNKRDKMQRQRQVNKARKGNSSTSSHRTNKKPVIQEKKKAISDLWIAIIVVAILVTAMLLIYHYANKDSDASIVVETPTITGTATPTTEATQESDDVSLMQWDSAPDMIIDTSKDYQAIIKTAKGDITIELADDLAPITVNNFVFLARQGYYDGVTFHRVIEGFMAQTGDPTGTGTGGPGYTIPDEFSDELRHDAAGIVSMANTGYADTGGSQFFITYSAQSHLDDVHSVFGHVIDGMDVLESLTLRVPGDEIQGDVIETIEIIES